MARIPRIGPTERQISPESPFIRRGDTAGLGGGLQESALALTNIIKDLDNIRRVEESTKAQNFLSTRLSQIESDALQDTDTSKERQKFYNSEIEQAQNDASQFITLPLERDLFSIDAANKSNTSALRVNNSFVKKITDSTMGEFITFTEQSKNQYIATDSREERNNVIALHDRKIDQLVNSGIMSREDAAKNRLKRDKDWIKAEFRKDLQDDPALAELKLNEGFYDFGEEEKVNAFTLVDKAKARVEKEATALVNEQLHMTEGATILNFLEGKLSPIEVQDSTDAQEISDLIGKNLIGVALSEKAVRARTKDDNLFKLMSEYYNLDDNNIDELRKFRGKVLLTHSTGGLSLDDAKSIINKTINPLELIEEQKGNKGLINAAMDTIRDLSTAIFEGNAAAVSRNRLTKGFFKSLTGLQITAESVQKALDKTVAEEQKKVNPNRAKYELNQTINTPAGTVKVVGFDIDGEPLVERVQ